MEEWDINWLSNCRTTVSRSRVDMRKVPDPTDYRDTERERERERAKYNVKEGLMTALFTDPAYCIIINDEVTNAT